MRRGKPGHVDAFRVGGSAELRMGNGGLIPGLVEEYSLIRRVLRGAYLRVHRIAVSPAVCLRMQKRVAPMEGMRQSQRDGRQKLESTFCLERASWS